MTKNQTSLLAALLLTTWAGTAHSALEDGKWYRYKSEHFEIYSKLSEKTVARSIRNLEAFRAVAHLTVGMEDQGDFGHTTKTFLLSGLSGTRRLAGGTPDIAGFMRPGLRQNILVIGRPESRSLTSFDEVAFHEYAHYLMRSASPIRYPMWYDEGFAELLSTIAIEDDHAIVGKIPLGAGYVLLSYKNMPLEELLKKSMSGDLKGLAMNKFYARAWLLVHYLSFSNAGGVRRKMLEYLTRYNAGEIDAETFEETFGLTFMEFDARLEKYTRAIPAYNVSLDRVAFDAHFDRERLTSQQIAYELGQASVPANPSYARKLFKKILRSEPDNARALTGLGAAEQMEKNYPAAESLMREALSLDEDDYLLHIDLADLLLVACRSRNGFTACPENPVIKEASGLYERAYVLDSTRLEAQVLHATMKVQQGDPEGAIKLLKHASRRAPWSYEVVRSLGVAYAANGNWSESRQYLNRALGWTADHAEEHGRIRLLLQQIAISEQLSRAAES